MGGLGPGYEQCIQILAAEILRSFLKNKPDASRWKLSDEWDKDKAVIVSDADQVIGELGPSGAQFGAAMNLATGFYMRGPEKCRAECESERMIMVSKNFPRLSA